MKINDSEGLSDAEQIQWDFYVGAQIDIWAQLFDLYKDGLISQEKWEYWDNGYWIVWQSNRIGEHWDGSAEMYDPVFQQYINSRRIELGLNEQ